MPAKRRTNRWTFDTTRDLVAWMQSEYLSELTLEDLDPVPAGGPVPATVRFKWLLHGTGAGKVVPYEVVAEEVQAWTLEGARDNQAVSIVAGEGPGVHLVLEVPGVLTLRCGRLSVARRPARKKPVPARPHTAYTYYVVSIEREHSVADVLAALGAPEGAELVSPGPIVASDPIRHRAPSFFELRAGGCTWLKVFNITPAGAAGFSLSVAREGATDQQWRRAQELPRLLGPAQVQSAWEFFGTDAEWSAMLARSDRSSR